MWQSPVLAVLLGSLKGEYLPWILVLFSQLGPHGSCKHFTHCIEGVTVSEGLKGKAPFLLGGREGARLQGLVLPDLLQTGCRWLAAEASGSHACPSHSSFPQGLSLELLQMAEPGAKPRGITANKGLKRTQGRKKPLDGPL